MTPSDRAPGRTNSWTPFIIMALVVSVALASSATPSPLYVDYQELWGTSGTTITFVYAVYCLAVLVPLLLFGRLSDTIGRRPVVVTGLLLVALSMALLAVAPDVTRLIVARVVQGVGVGLVSGVAGAAIVELHPTRDARIGALTTGAGMNFGIASGVLLAGLVAMWSPLPLVYPYVVIGVLVVVLVVAVLALVPETAGRGRGGLRDGLRLQRLAVPAGARPTFALAAACVVASWSVGGVFLGLGGALTRDLLGRSDYLMTGLVVAVLQGAAALTQLVWNLRAATWGPRRGVMIGVIMLVGGLVAASVGFHARSVPAFTVAVAVVGAGMGLLFLMGSTLAAYNVPDEVRGQVLSAFFVVAYISLGLPAVIAAFLAGITGLAAAYHLLALVVGLIAVATLGIVTRSRIGV